MTLDPFQREMIDTMARVETRLDHMEDLAKRVTALEVFQARVLAGVAALSAIAGACADYIREKLFS